MLRLLFKFSWITIRLSVVTPPHNPDRERLPRDRRAVAEIPTPPAPFAHRPSLVDAMDPNGVRRRDTTKGPPLRVLSLGMSPVGNCVARSEAQRNSITPFQARGC